MIEKHQLDFSVIIPSYNYAQFIEMAIRSVINQAYKAREIIVIDDGSTDDTRAVIKTLQDKSTGHNICYYRQENRGVSAARNLGYQKSLGAYVMFLDADGKLLPNAFEHFNLAISSNKEAEMIFGGYRAISYSGKVRNRQPEKLALNRLHNVAKLLGGDMVGLRPSSTILKRSVMEELNFSEKVHVDEDTMFFSHVFANYNCVSIPEILVEMPRHSGSLRENYQRIVETGLQGVDELSDSLPDLPDLNALKQHVLLKRYLKIGRKACICHEYKAVVQNYMQAFMLKPSSIFSWKHFPRLIKSLILQAL